MRIDSPADLDGIDFDRAGGLVTVIAQHARTGVVLMLAHANRAAVERTLETGELWYWSRSRAELWRKGATSGNTQKLVALHADCDADALLALVEPHGPSCHTGAWSCFDARSALPALADVIAQRRRAVPAGSYTARLLADENLRLKKLGEEAIELALACAARDAAGAAAEAADLVYHVLVACAGVGVDLDDVLRVLAARSATWPPQEDAVDAE